VNDPTGFIVNILNDALAADGGPAVTVRGGRRYTGEAGASGDQPPLVIVRRLTRRRFLEIAARYRFAVISFAVDPKRATDLDLRVSAALGWLAPSVSASGVAIYLAREEVGGQPGIDPDTDWSTETSIYIVHAATEAVAST
jgi:hypothetical protein